MADDLSLLFRLRAEATGVRAATAETRAAIAQLRQGFGTELSQMRTLSRSALSEITSNLNLFVGQRIPLVGGLFIRVTENIRQLGAESTKQAAAVRQVTQSIADLSAQTGKGIPAITRFLTEFVKIEGQANRDAAAVRFFGAQVVANNQKLIPELEKTATGLAGVAAESEAAGASLLSTFSRAATSPAGIAIIALVALGAASAVVTKQFFDLAASTAAVEGKLFDLSQQTGVSVETLSALDVLFSTTGGNINTATQALIQFQRQLEEAQDPTSEAGRLFGKFNVSVDDTETALRETLAALAAMPEGFSQTNAAAEFFGARGGKQFLAILKESKGDLDGTIERLREMGLLLSTEDAKAADQLNDELELLHRQFALISRSIGRDLLPAAIELAQAFRALIQQVTPFFEIIGPPGIFILESAAKGLQGLRVAIAAVTLDYRELARAAREAHEETQIPAISGIPSVSPVPLPGPPSELDKVREETRLVRAEVAEAVRFAESQAAQIERNLQARAIDSVAAVRGIIEAEKAKSAAVVRGLEQERQARVGEFDKEKGDKQKLADQLQDIDEQINDERERLRQFELNEQAKFRAKELTDAQEHRRRMLDVFVQASRDQIAAINRSVQEGRISPAIAVEATIGILEIEFKRRRELLEQELAEAGSDVSLRRRIQIQLNGLQQEYTRVLKEQADRHTDIRRKESEDSIQLQLLEVDRILQIGRIADEARIAALRTLADARIRTEEDTARDILRIRLDAIDRETTAVQAALTTARTIIDPQERLRRETELNNQLKILAAQRAAIQQEGEREIERGRQDDLDNERNYAEELRDIQQRIVDIQQDTAREVIDALISTNARRRDIIIAQRDFELADEDERHRRATEEIDRERRDVDEQIRLLERRLARQKVGTDEEIEQHDRIIAKLEELRLKRAELERQQDAEDERRQTRRRRVTVESEEDLERADPLGRLKVDTQDIKDFAAELENSVVPLAGILARAFSEVANAIGQVTRNWVLLGTTGPAVMRKVLAASLATIAAEAAVNAIKQLAIGFAMLAIGNFKSATEAFTSAGLWAAIGGVAAIAGRGLAGNLFQTQTAGGHGGTPLGHTRAEEGPVRDIVREQAREPQIVILRVESNDSHIVRVVEQDVGNNGPLRNLIVRVAES